MINIRKELKNNFNIANQKIQKIFANIKLEDHDLELKKHLFKQLFPDLYIYLNTKYEQRCNLITIRKFVNEFLKEYNLPVPFRNREFLNYYTRKVSTTHNINIKFINTVEKIYLTKNIKYIYDLFGAYSEEQMLEDYATELILNICYENY